MLEAFIETSTLSYVLYAVIVALAALNVSRIKTPKLSGNPVNVWLLATYTIAMTGIHTWMLS